MVRLTSHELFCLGCGGGARDGSAASVACSVACSSARTIMRLRMGITDRRTAGWHVDRVAFRRSWGVLDSCMTAMITDFFWCLVCFGGYEMIGREQDYEGQ